MPPVPAQSLALSAPARNDNNNLLRLRLQAEAQAAADGARQEVAALEHLMRAAGVDPNAPAAGGGGAYGSAPASRATSRGRSVSGGGSARQQQQEEGGVADELEDDVDGNKENAGARLVQGRGCGVGGGACVLLWLSAICGLAYELQ